MASRKEEKERLRQERLAAQQRESASAQRRLYLGYGVAGLLGLAVVVGLVIVIASSGGGNGDGGSYPEAAHIDQASGAVPNDVEADGRESTAPPEIQQANLRVAAKDAGCELRTDLSDEGNDHVPGGLEYAKYGTNPPTSGDHDPEPLADGAYLATPPIGGAVHAMEHGRIEIQYSTKLAEDDQLALKGVFDEDPEGMLLFPNDEMPYEVAATAWTQLLGCKTYEGESTLDAIRDFRDTYRGNGPEPIPL